MAEGNQVKWRGIRPVYPVENIQTHPGIFETTVAGITRTHIAKSVEIDNTTEVIHTVTAGKTFYLCGFAMSADSGVDKITCLEVRNAADVVQYCLGHLVTAALAVMQSSLAIIPPIPIAAGFDIALRTTNSDAHAFIHGWEQ